MNFLEILSLIIWHDLLAGITSLNIAVQKWYADKVGCASQGRGGFEKAATFMATLLAICLQEKADEVSRIWRHTTREAMENVAGTKVDFNKSCMYLTNGLKLTEVSLCCEVSDKTLQN